MCNETYRTSGGTPEICPLPVEEPKISPRRWRPESTSSLGEWIFYLTLPVFIVISCFFLRGNSDKAEGQISVFRKVCVSILVWSVVPAVILLFYGQWGGLIIPAVALGALLLVANIAAASVSDEYLPYDFYYKHPLVRLQREPRDEE